MWKWFQLYQACLVEQQQRGVIYDTKFRTFRALSWRRALKQSILSVRIYSPPPPPPQEHSTHDFFFTHSSVSRNVSISSLLLLFFGVNYRYFPNPEMNKCVRLKQCCPYVVPSARRICSCFMRASGANAKKKATVGSRAKGLHKTTKRATL